MAYPAKQNSEIDEAALRAAGFIPKVIWVQDVNAPGFAEELRRQMRILAEADSQDPTIDSFSEAALADLDLPPYEER